MANVTYTVKKGDTLSQIALNYSTTVSKLVELNHITDPDYIVVGQVLIVSGTASKAPSSTSYKATVKAFGLQSNTDRTVYATWAWTKSNTENYQTIWYYDTGDGVWFVGTDTTTTYKQATYNAPSNANRVKFKVKPISKKRTVNKKETSYWTASWSTEKTYNFDDNPPTVPPVPNVEITSKNKLTAKIENLTINADTIEFQIIKGNTTVYKTGKAKIKTNTATYSTSVASGYEYKVRCRAYRSTTKEYGGWSTYSENVNTIPHAPTDFITCKATSNTSVYLEWSPVTSATSYEIEYTTKKEYFDGSDQTTTQGNIEYTHFEKTGLESGTEYFFRVRAVNSKGSSAWSGITSVIIGKKPAAPTTWSSSTTVVTGEELKLYWVHNTEDNSSQTKAELELYVNGTKEVLTITNTTNEEEKDKTSVYTIDTSTYDEGSTIQWRVRTAGITGEYGDWSIQRRIDVYATPTMELSMTDSTGNDITSLEQFPFYISAITEPASQKPTGYHVSILANEAYETVDAVGNVVMVNAGDTVYSRYVDTNEALEVIVSAGDINLDNNASYTILCVAAMDSGLKAEGVIEFTVAWSDEVYEPDAEIGIDRDNYTAMIRPYCEDENGNPIENVLLSVYRREFDGRLTEIETDIDNTSNTFVTDPHPALDFARYRIVATSTETGAVSYYDVPGYPVDEKSVIIQWDEQWSSFDSLNEDALEDVSWSGSLLKLPYNIDVSDSNDPDVVLVKYIGREHPVTYYGTQIGSSSTWNVAIPKDDEETIYALRRLSRWMGDVYVREPSGTGYWANIKVSFSQKHREVTIPVTLQISRVEGGA